VKEEGETERDICRGPRETESGKTNRGRQHTEGQSHRDQGDFIQHSNIKAERRKQNKSLKNTEGRKIKPQNQLRT